MKCCRNLNQLNQNELQKIIYDNKLPGVYVDLCEMFSEEEIIDLINHPLHEEFSADFQEHIWQTVMKIFERDLRGREELH
jgi:hypothetical protein